MLRSAVFGMDRGISSVLPFYQFGIDRGISSVLPFGMDRGISSVFAVLPREMSEAAARKEIICNNR